MKIACLWNSCTVLLPPDVALIKILSYMPMLSAFVTFIMHQKAGSFFFHVETVLDYLIFSHSARVLHEDFMDDGAVIFQFMV